MSVDINVNIFLIDELEFNLAEINNNHIKR